MNAHRPLTTQLSMQPMTNLVTWLHMAAQVYAPQQVVLVGAGNGTGPVVQGLLSLQAMPRFSSLEVHALEAHALSLAQLVKRLGPDSIWQLSADVVLSPHVEDSPTYHHYSLGTESSLLPPNDLQILWPNLQLISEQPASSGVPMNNLLNSRQPSPWLLLDCLPAAHLLQGADLSHTHVLLARVVLGAPDISPSGCTLAQLQAQLVPQGYQLAAGFAERNTQLAKTLWLRDPAWLQHQAKAQALSQTAELTKANEQSQIQLRAALNKSTALQKQASELNSKLSVLAGKHQNALLQQEALKKELLKIELQIELIKNLMEEKAVNG